MEETTIQETTGLELDFDILNRQQKTVTSMADLYGYSVFAEEFARKVTGYQKRSKEERDYYLRCVLTNPPGDDIQIAFQRVFDADITYVVGADYEMNDVSQMSFLSTAMFALFGAALALSFWMLIDKRRKEKRLHENKHHHD